jgi:hypothetical protein
MTPLSDKEWLALKRYNNAPLSSTWRAAIDTVLLQRPVSYTAEEVCAAYNKPKPKPKTAEERVHEILVGCGCTTEKFNEIMALIGELKKLHNAPVKSERRGRTQGEVEQSYDDNVFSSEGHE